MTWLFGQLNGWPFHCAVLQTLLATSPSDLQRLAAVYILNNGATAMKIEAPAQAGQNQSSPRWGAAIVSTGIFHLWEKVASRLTTEELEWFAKYTSEAERESQNLASIVMDIGCLVGADTDAGSFRSQSSISTLLFSISHQVDTISGMIYIGSCAEHRLRHPELYSIMDLVEKNEGEV
jgi:hypothetical protein